MEKIRILLVDDHAMIRSGLRYLVNAQPEMEVVGEAGDAAEAFEQARRLRPDVITLDLAMPGGGSLKMVERLLAECPNTRVLVLTMLDDPAYMRSAMAVGAAGYVVKAAADVELLRAIRAVHRGRFFVNLDLEDSHSGIQRERQSARSRSSAATALSQREQQVLEFLSKGHTNQAIANRLGVSVKTVATYRARIAEKTGLQTRADFVRFGVETGILQRHISAQ